MKTFLLLAILACALMVAVVGCKHQNGAEDVSSEEMISKTSAPPVVSHQFETDFPGASITKVEKETYKDGTVHYEYKFWQNGKKQEVEYNADGDRVEEKD
jgi:hypothetical protein